MEESTKYLLVGGGVASVWAAINIRERDKEGRILIVTNENHPPYDKPPLSKSYIAKDDVPIDDAYSKFDNFYPDNNIELRQGHAATHVDRAGRSVALDNGDTIRYEKLLLATGSDPRKLALFGAELAGIHYLRTIDDANGIHEEAKSGRKAVLIGAGFLNMEVASGCLARGCQVTVLEQADRPWGRLASVRLGDFLTRQYELKGARLHFGEEVSGITGNGRVSSVQTKSGNSFDADFVVIAIGASLRTGLAKAAGLEMGSRDGVQVDEYLQTSDPYIWAAGDIACFQDIALGRRWHAEHHLNAKWQGRAVGAVMAGDRKPYNQVPYFFSDFLDLHMILRGDPAGSTEAESIILGDLAKGEFVELYPGVAGRLRMGLAISHDEKTTDAISDKLEELIRAKATVDGLNAGSFGL